MRLRVRHTTRYRYATPVSQAIQLVRLTPRTHVGQFVHDWRIDVTGDARLMRWDDAFGNITHAFTLDGPLSELAITACGDLETEDTAGVVRGTVERLPLEVYLRETPLTAASPEIRAFAGAARAASDGNALDLAHRLNVAIHEAVEFDPDGTDVTTVAADVLTHRRGVCQDLAHLLLAAARHAGLPARYVSGYIHAPELAPEHRASHAWTEAHVPDLGWIALDPSTGLSATDGYVRLAVGLDYLGASPIRGTRYGGAGETLEVEVDVDARRPDPRMQVQQQ